MKKLFGTDGIRGIANVSLTCETANNLGKAAGMFLYNKGHTKPSVLIVRDTRASGAALSAALSAGLMAAGTDVLDAGVLPTPAAAYLVSHYSAHAAAVVSASHNPPEYNGIKLFAGDGRKLPDADEETIEALMEEKPRLLNRDFGKLYDFSSAAAPYCEYIIKRAPRKLNGMRIVLDCAFGAAYFVAPKIFRELGAEITAFNSEDKGALINEGCGAACPEAIGRYTAETASVGFAFDGDADRCMAAENGVIFDGDRLLYAHAADYLKRGLLKNKGVSGTVLSNLGLEKALGELGIKLYRADVGDRYVAETMEKEGLLLGGETSGHIIFSGEETTGDGILTAVKTACLMKKTGKTLAELSAPLIDYPIKSYNIAWDGRDPLQIETIVAAFEAGKAAMGGNGRIVLRRSGTEPKLRIMVQGADAGLVNKVALQLKEAAEKLCAE